MLVFLGFSLTILLGLLLTLLIVPKMHPLERLGASYVLGLGLLTLFMFFYYLMGFKFNLTNTLGVLLLLILPLFILEKGKIGPYLAELKSKLGFKGFSLVEKGLVLAITGFILYSLICTLYWPVRTWDVLVLYDWRAKLFVDTGGMEEAIARGYFFGYPLLTSLAHSWVYLLGGVNPLFIYSLFLTAFTLMFYGAVRDFSPRTFSLIITLLFVTTPSILGSSTFAYTNFPYTVYFVMGSVYLYYWTIKKKNGYLIMAALMVGLSTWTRSSEPFWLAPLGALILYSFFRRKFLVPILYSLIFFPIQQSWLIYQEKMIETKSTIGQITESASILTRGIDFMRIKEMFLYLVNNVFVLWQPIFILFLIFILFEFKKYRWKNNYFFLVLILANFTLLALGVYIFTYTFVQWRSVPDSAARMSMFFPPLFLYYIATSKYIRDFLDL
jgi:hypothetical protein